MNEGDMRKDAVSGRSCGNQELLHTGGKFEIEGKHRLLSRFDDLDGRSFLIAPQKANENTYALTRAKERL
jgi:hypothetical protein